MEEKRNIYQRMLMIQTELGVVFKSQVVDGDYSAVKEGDVLNAVKPLESKYGVYSYPIKRNLINLQVGDNVAMRVETTYRFVNIDDKDDYLEIISYGDGVDTYDKAPGKAMTYSDKYALMKAYKITTGDDPDQNASPNGDDSEPADPKNSNATADQEAQLKSMLSEERFGNMLKTYKVNSVREMSFAQAAEVIEKIQKRIIKV